MTVSFIDQIKTADIPDVQRQSDQMPRIWWYNGIKQTKTPGNFYTKEAEFIDGLGEPWTTDDRFEGENGYSTPVLKIAILTYRQQPYREVEEPGQTWKRKEWANKWEPGMRLYTEVLCLIQGYDGLVVWCSDGLTGKAVSGKQGIIKTYEAGLLAEAERMAQRTLPYWSFWLPIATKRKADGSIAFEDTGYGSFVTPPALLLPAEPIDALYVGNEMLERGGRLMRQHANWSKQRRGNDVEAEVVSVAALPAPRNAPVAITDDEI